MLTEKNNPSNEGNDKLKVEKKENTKKRKKEIKITQNYEGTALLRYVDNEVVDSMPYIRVVSLVKKIAEEEKLPEEVKFEYKTTNRSGEFKIPLAEMTNESKLAEQLFINHITIKPPYKYEIFNYLTKQLDMVYENSYYDYEHKIIGWYEIEGKNYFLLDDTTLENGKISKCIRDVGKFQNGSEVVYDEMLEKFVYNNPAMSLAYTLGFSGVLVSRISHYVDLGVLLVGLSGQSSTGKSTAMKLQASIFADTDDVKGRMIMRNQGSENGFQAQFKGIHGPCILFDDMDQNNKNSDKIGELIHLMSKGTTRVVSNISGDALFNRGSYSGTIIFTSECSLLDKTNKEMGMLVRFLDLGNIQWTKDGPSAEAIKECVSKNYGFKGKKFGKFLENFSDEELVKEFEASRNFVTNNISNRDQFFHRISKKLAAIVATANLLNKCFNIKLDIDEMLNILIQAFDNNAAERNRPLEAYKAIFEYFKKNYTKFNILAGDYKPYNLMSKDRNVMGFARINFNEVHIGISINDCKQILNQLGFTQLQNYAEYWKKNELTQTAKDRTTCSSTTTLKSRHYHFIYPNAKEELNLIMPSYFEVLNSDEEQEELNQIGFGSEIEDLKQLKTQDNLKEIKIKNAIGNFNDCFNIDDSEAIDELFKEEV